MLRSEIEPLAEGTRGAGLRAVEPGEMVAGHPGRMVVVEQVGWQRTADAEALVELADRWNLRSSVNRVLAAFAG